jgi:hypothetical protein
MDATARQIYSLMKLKILLAMKGTEPDKSWFFAWFSDVYPALHVGPLQEAFRDAEGCFQVSQTNCLEVFEIIRGYYERNEPATWDDLWNRVRYSSMTDGSAWDGGRLMRVCRYLCLSGNFDRSFWERFIEVDVRSTWLQEILKPFELPEVECLWGQPSVWCQSLVGQH